jgi:hypothetical protein
VISAPANPGSCGVQSVANTNPAGNDPPSNAQTHSFTFVNKMDQTIWVGATGTAVANTDGWDGELAPGASHSVTVSTPTGNEWSGRFWGRTECVNGKCVTGDCGSTALMCAGASSGNASPATLAEFALNAYDGEVFYDISLVDGFNLPMQIVPSDGSPSPDNCGSQACVNLNTTCPTALQKKDASGAVVTCMSACAAFGTDQYCCLGQYNATTCNPDTWPSNVDSAKFFKAAYPHDYSYAYDDSTSTYTCAETCSYSIVFGLTP